MTITTMYEVGQLVFFFDDNQLCHSVISGIELEITLVTNSPGIERIILYRVKNGEGKYIGVEESLLFKDEFYVIENIKNQLHTLKQVV